MKKIFALSLLITFTSLMGIAVLLGAFEKSSITAASEQTSVSIQDGTQIIKINAKGGYFPRQTTAKANTPTVLQVVTNGTFDCSSALTIPSLNYRTNLPPSDITSINVPPQPANSTLKGLCSMGMYTFTVNFR